MARRLASHEMLIPLHLRLSLHRNANASPMPTKTLIQNWTSMRSSRRTWSWKSVTQMRITAEPLDG
eukprot:4418855-Pyramimonas_sp.AAC.1